MSDDMINLAPPLARPQGTPRCRGPTFGTTGSRVTHRAHLAHLNLSIYMNVTRYKTRDLVSLCCGISVNTCYLLK